MMQPRVIASAACAGPWGSGMPALIDWCAIEPAARPEPVSPPPVPGFIESQFNPLVNLVLRESLADPELLPGTGILLGSVAGDTTTADVASRNLLSGRVRNPLLFYQSIPNSILGYVSRQFGVTGPMACVAGTGALYPDLLEMADMWLDRPGVRRVVLVDVELAANPRSEVAYAAPAGAAARRQEFDAAVALVLAREVEPAGEAAVTLSDLRVGPDEPADDAGASLVLAEASQLPARLRSQVEAGCELVAPLPLSAWGGLAGLLDLCAAAERLRRLAPPASALLLDTRSGPQPVEIRLALR